METVGLVSDSSCWNSFDLSISAGDESEVMAQFFGEQDLLPMFGTDNISYNWPVGNCSTISAATNTSAFFSTNTNYDQCYLNYYANDVHATNVNSEPIEFGNAEKQNSCHHCQFNLPLCMSDDTSIDDPIGKKAVPFLSNNHNAHAMKRSFHITDLEKPPHDDGIPVERLHKDARALGLIVPKRRKNAQFRSKTQSSEDKSKVGLNAQSSSCYTSEDDELNASKEPNGTVNQKQKVRAARGTATDPQSIYAKKRRERINERLRTLQNLVPNGTKVDISTMLEEAVRYVKFLQLQIKLLSSDELWMYAPIAYNGINIGLDLRISTAI